MQINPSYQLPLLNPRVQPPELSSQPELLKKPKGTFSEKAFRSTSEPIIEAEYVDLHQPTTRPVTPKPPQNIFILEQSSANSFNQTRSSAQPVSLHELLQGIEVYRKDTHQDNIPSGLYIDFFA